jgi:iron(III) transport system ATP-binding protein
VSGAHLAVSNLGKRFGPVVAVDSVSLELEKGAFLALLGPSGCGKTTLLRLLAGFERPDNGTITLGGRVLEDPRNHLPPEQRHVGLVFQEHALFPHMDVAANVGFGVRGRAARKEKVQEMLELVGLAGLGRRMPHELSGGQQQRVALARTLAAEPGLVLLDEPFSNLDPTLRARVRSEVWGILREFGATAIVVTHDQEEAFSLPGLVGVMLEGRLHQVDSPLRIYQEPVSRDVAAFVGDANFLPGERRGGSVSWAFAPFASPGPDEPVEVMVRPEDLSIDESPHVAARIQEAEFFGRDQVVVVALDDGKSLRVRLLRGLEFERGQRVGLRLSGTPRVYPATSHRAKGV